MNVLVAGGAGYIGSHTVKRLKEAGHSPVIYDNASRGHRAVVDILRVPAVVADVGESVDKPLMYYQNNVATTISVLEAMRDAGVNRFVFSITCAVYRDP